MQLNHYPSPRPSQGFTLLEVLVALVVLSIGLLGLSGLQTTSLRNNHSAFLRSQATLVTTNIIDRMMANRDAAVNGDYNINFGTTPASNTCATGCSATDVAQVDILEWRAYVERLPGGESQIQLVSVPIAGVNHDVADVRVRWADTRGSGAPLELVTRVQL